MPDYSSPAAVAAITGILYHTITLKSLFDLRDSWKNRSSEYYWYAIRSEGEGKFLCDV